MASVQLQFDTQLPSIVTLTLTAQEAQLVRDMTAKVGGNTNARTLVNGIQEALTEAGFNSSGKTSNPNLLGSLRASKKLTMNYKGNTL